MRHPLGVLAIASIVAGSVAARAETTVEIRSRPEPVAEPPARIHIGYVNGTISLDHAKLELEVASHAIVGTLTLAYSSTEPVKNLVVPLAFPHGTSLRRLVATTGVGNAPRAARVSQRRVGNAPRAALASQRLVGKPLAATEARALYDDLVNGQRDPALLTWRDRDETSDRVALEVFPIGRGSPGVVEIGFELPRTSRVVLDPDGQLVDRVELVVNGRRTSKAWVSAELPIAMGAVKPSLRPLRPSLVSSGQSLVAAPPGARVVVPVITLGCSFGHSTGMVDKHMIRRTVKRAYPRLLHCFMKTAQANPALAGTANLHFTVDNGRATAISIDGDLDHPEVVSCMSREISTWEFPRPATTATSTPERVQVNYPLQFSAR